MAKQEQEAINLLPVNLQKYALAKQSEIISRMPKAEGVKVIDKAILKVIFDLGWGKKADNVLNEENERILTAANCYDLIKDRYQSLTIEELKLAFLNGSLENYGKIVGLGLKTLSDWLKGYSNDENKKKAMAEWNRLLDQVLIKNYSDEQKEEIIVSNCLEFFEEYKTNGMLNQIVKKPDKLMAIFYDKLKEKGILKQSPELRKNIFERAENEYNSYLEKSLKDPKVKFNKSDLEKILEVAAQDNKPFINMVKRTALLEFFDELIKNGKELKTLFN